MNARTIRAEASAWLSKLHGPERSVRLEADFQAWLAAKPEHARAFEQVTDVWETLGRVEPASASRFANPRPIAAQRPRRALRFAWAYVLVGLAVLGFWQLQGPTYRTDIGEQLTINLEDGSRLSLNSGSRVEVDFARHTRTVRLLRGEAFFEVAHDKSRPFTVIAGERAITAVGTAFVVRHDEDEVSVTLVEGRVVVTPREGAAVPSDPKAPVAPVAVPLV
ncbi:FecR family protein, partial [Steroidobacter sp.]|uniref:FecR family protein n=1 Tax=Steroidobacter sp. TaxID=1978227 RepID=UPI001A379737